MHNFGYAFVVLESIGFTIGQRVSNMIFRRKSSGVYLINSPIDIRYETYFQIGLILKVSRIRSDNVAVPPTITKNLQDPSIGTSWG